MAVAGTRQAGFLDRLKAEVQRDTKKALILGTLMLVLIGAVVREIVRRRGPAQATAAATTSVVAPRPAALTAAAAQAAAQGDSGQEDKPLELGRLVVDRDMFTPDPVYFPPKQKPRPVAVATPVDEEAARREAERKAVQAQARALTLQSTMVGSAAIINGQVLRVGDWINGFQVVEIAVRSCTVEKSSMRVTLEMAN